MYNVLWFVNMEYIEGNLLTFVLVGKQNSESELLGWFVFFVEISGLEV